MPTTGPAPSRGRDRLAWLAAAVIVAAGAAAYAGSLHGPWLYDDQGSVVDNASIRSLTDSFRPPASGWPVSGRPLFNFSLALNYAVSGLNVRSYHALSVALHLAAALFLFGIVRRTLAHRGHPPGRALAVAWAAGLLWVVHPLLTEAVAYVSQRSEVLMGMFYLGTLYCFVRYSEVERVASDALGRPQGCEQPGGMPNASRATRSTLWGCLCVAACVCGMASKEVMATAPLIVFLYDRIFVSGGFREAWKRHRRLHLALAATWILLAFLMFQTRGRGGTAGFGAPVAWWAYGLTQFRAVAHYLRLCLWPHPLLFNYGMTLGAPPLQLAWDGTVVLGLAAVSLVAAFGGSSWGFLGVWFFLILAPTSSVVPISTELIAEHRAYLSLAAVVVAAVVTVDWAVREGGRPARISALIALVVISGAAGMATAARNRAYGSVLALWAATVRDAPDDAGARNNLGNALAEKGRLAEAAEQYEAALRLVPGYDDPHFNLANALVKLGRPDEAIPHYRAALRVQPDNAHYRYALGIALRKSGRNAEAREQFAGALAGTTEEADVWYDLGTALLAEDDMAGAEKAFARAISRRPDYADAVANHAAVLAQLGREPEAIAEFQRALRLEPDAPDVHNNLGGLLAESGRLAEAREQFQAALRLKPDYREARDNLERVEAMLGASQ